MRRRIWCELLPAEELGAPATVALLERLSLEPIVALPPGGDTPAMAAALKALSRASVRVGLWPLLNDEQGYWPSAVNAADFCRRTREVVAFAKQAGVRLGTVAVDLEPPLGVVRRLLQSTPAARVAHVAGELRALREPRRVRARREARAMFGALRAELSAAGIETMAAVMPPIALDMAWQSGFWQALLRTPVRSPGWSVLSPMMYTTIISAMLPGGSMAVTRALVFELGRALVASVGTARASMSLGLVGSGKLGSEPTYSGPQALVCDVQVARAAGIDDLALFSLEGALNRGNPEHWLLPFTMVAAAPPRGLAGSLAATAFRAGISIGRLASRVSS